MIRLLAILATLAALAAVAWAGQGLRIALETPLPAPASAQAPLTGAAPDLVRAAPQPPRDWPALFGEVVIPEPQPPAPPPPRPEPQPPAPPAPPAPPIESLGYTLRGVVSDGENRWAMVSHPTGEQLLRVGDMLGETYEIVAIDTAGLWGRSSPGAEAVLLGFAE